jgi:hypothetical protein
VQVTEKDFSISLARNTSLPGPTPSRSPTTDRPHTTSP